MGVDRPTLAHVNPDWPPPESWIASLKPVVNNGILATGSSTGYAAGFLVASMSVCLIIPYQDYLATKKPINHTNWKRKGNQKKTA